MGHSTEIAGVTVQLKANVYFDGKVVSHTLVSSDGQKKTVGLIFPGSYSFNTQVPERMDILAGACRVRPANQTTWKDYPAGTSFSVPGNSRFEVAVDEGIAEYLCHFEGLPPS